MTGAPFLNISGMRRLKYGVTEVRIACSGNSKELTLPHLQATEIDFLYGRSAHGISGLNNQGLSPKGVCNIGY